MHIHLDPVGGIAGDMFVGALLDTYPEFANDAIAAVHTAGLEDAVTLAHIPYTDGILDGSRFEVTIAQSDHGRAHDHVRWLSLKQRLSECPLSPHVRARAIDIFTHLAEAEAEVHGKAVESVAFHEVGAWDSIADIVAAAYIIESLGSCTWSIGALPIGSGRVATQHGMLPVPAPATVLLLSGFDCFDDGFPGERVTPTGAAIVKHLVPKRGIGALPRRLEKTGYGFGRRRFEGLSNVLRLLQFDSVSRPSMNTDKIMVVQFEIDDQTPEDLAIGLDRIRMIEGVVDVSQSAVTGKQGRQLTGIRVLAKPEMIDTVTDACFHETTTLGLRLQLTDRLILPRRELRANDGVRIKIAERPTGPTAKADVTDVTQANGHRERQARRHAAEAKALAGDERDE